MRKQINGHWLMSCYACGKQLHYPTKLANDPLHPNEKVSVCNGKCSSMLYKLKIKLDKNDEAISKILNSDNKGIICQQNII